VRPRTDTSKVTTTLTSAMTALLRRKVRKRVSTISRLSGGRGRDRRAVGRGRGALGDPGVDVDPAHVASARRPADEEPKVEEQ